MGEGLCPPVCVGGRPGDRAGQGPHAPPDAGLSAFLMEQLAAAAASAGAEGPVDVHVSGPRRYHLPASTQAAGAPAAEAESSIGSFGHSYSGASPPLALHQVVPPCLTPAECSC
jgi:hypothetical protein